MKRKNNLILGAALLMTAQALNATPDDNNDGVQQTLTVNEETVDRTVSEIRIDGNNAVLLLSDGTTLTADMHLVTLTMSYDEATGINRLNMKDKDGNVKVYDLLGKEVERSKRGIYIVNGKKVLKRY